MECADRVSSQDTGHHFVFHATFVRLKSQFWREAFLTITQPHSLIKCPTRLPATCSGRPSRSNLRLYPLRDDNTSPHRPLDNPSMQSNAQTLHGPAPSDKISLPPNLPPQFKTLVRNNYRRYTLRIRRIIRPNPTHHERALTSYPTINVNSNIASCIANIHGFGLRYFIT